MSKKPAKSKPISPDTPFEKAADELQQIVGEVETGDIPLNESLEHYEQGMKLVRHCRGILDAAEQKIKSLSLDELDPDGESRDDTPGDSAP